MVHQALLALALTLPPAARTVTVVAFVYTVLQLLKRQAWAVNWLYGWRSIAFNVLLSVAGLVATVPATQLYTWPTAQTLVLTALGAAGVHGTIKTMGGK